MNEYGYNFINDYNAQLRPSTVHCSNTTLVGYFKRYFMNKVMSCYDITIPDSWARNYFQYALFGLGHAAVFDAGKEFGVICQAGSLSGFNVFYQPSRYVFGNPVIGSRELKIGQDCEVVKILPDYSGLMDAISLYADLMGLCVEGAGVNLVNSKLAYVFAAQNKAAAESFKKLYDKVASGEPMVVIDKSLFNVDGSANWQTFTQNLGQQYITDRILNPETHHLDLFFEMDWKRGAGQLESYGHDIECSWQAWIRRTGCLAWIYALNTDGRMR